jgi:hypothetical protein
MLRFEKAKTPAIFSENRSSCYERGALGQLERWLLEHNTYTGEGKDEI